MSDRMKRRKKGDGASKEKTAKGPEPLQPKYFESEIGEKPAEREVEAPAPEHLAPKHSGRERSTAEQDRIEKETQADFQLASRRPPELPLAEAIQGEGRNRPTRRRRKRGGGRGGGRRGPVGAQAVGRGASAVLPVDSAAEIGATETAAEVSDGAAFEEPLTPENPLPPLTPESAGEEAAAIAARSIAAPVAAAQSSTVQVAPAGAGAATPVVAARPSKGTVVLAIGLPGSGKSSWFKRHNIHPLSSDLLRELLFDDALEQRFQDLVFSNLRSMLKARLIARRPMNYVDATNLTPHDRHSWIKLAKDYGYDVQGLFFDVPLEVCLERHQKRGRAVPEDIMRKMAGKLRPPTFEEGFSKITVVRVKQKDAAAS